ncbi:hypothetical protein [Peribacillus sp. ACCC06369]|uniref:hypothetical protein n=1 Tax=Peribacillus sp. ACCC06369 TaxID=3055860 RepID=UPI0025A23608|nr:hypothetical protein [Peribacillus sp. ACCC06369]MDM5357201.1 hypothetical protein [Peribacillus sp. ACCC06369]
MWGRYLWKLRLLLTIPYLLLFAILMFELIDNRGYYWLLLVVYMLFSSIILHKMEKKEKE